jgi:prolyl-tRNA editing enzyme YbaK/EbsC (Cys-tRNA(Pro) deacylase)
MPSSSARRVQEALDAHGLNLEVVELPKSTRSAAEAARAVSCEVGEIAKSLVFRGKATQQAILVIASGANTVDLDKVGHYACEPIEKADADFVRAATGFAIGGVPPLGHDKPLMTFLDEELFVYKAIWAAAGTPNAVFKLTPAELLKITRSIKIAVR